MFKRRSFYGLIAFFCTLFFAQGAIADQEIILERVFTSITPVFMEGHDGEPDWIEGFDFTCDILLNGNPSGTCSGQNRMLNPPQDLVERYDNWMTKIYSTITGKGTFESTGIGTALGSSSPDGDITFAWHGSLSNGTGALSNIYGWSAGTGSANLFLQQGGATEIIQYRFGF